MPTRENLVHLESLIDAATLLLETKKNVDRVEHDIRLMMGRIAVARRDEQLGGGEGGEIPMDVDQEAVADDDDTGIHAGRGARKKNVGVSAKRDCKVWRQADPPVYRRGGPCRYLLLTPRLNPGGPTKGRNRAEPPIVSSFQLLPPIFAFSVLLTYRPHNLNRYGRQCAVIRARAVTNLQSKKSQLPLRLRKGTT